MTPAIMLKDWTVYTTRGSLRIKAGEMVWGRGVTCRVGVDYASQTARVIRELREIQTREWPVAGGTLIFGQEIRELTPLEQLAAAEIEPPAMLSYTDIDSITRASAAADERARAYYLQERS